MDLDVNMSEADRIDTENGRWLKTRPVCSVCGEPIQDDEALFIFGEWICKRCVETNTIYVESEIYGEL